MAVMIRLLTQRACIIDLAPISPGFFGTTVFAILLVCNQAPWRLRITGEAATLML